MCSGKYSHFIFFLQNQRSRLHYSKGLAKLWSTCYTHSGVCFGNLRDIGGEDGRRVQLDQNRAQWEASVFVLSWTWSSPTPELGHKVSCYLVPRRQSLLEMPYNIRCAASSNKFFLKTIHKWSTPSLLRPNCGTLLCLLVYPIWLSVNLPFRPSLQK